MKSFLLVFISALVARQTLGYYVPTISEIPLESSCGCSGKFPLFLDDIAGKHQYPERDLKVDTYAPNQAQDVKYRFNFAVQKAAEEEPQNEPRSFGYEVESPVSDRKEPEPKYHFDYSLQAPAEEKPVENQERPLYTRIDKVVEDQPGCTCNTGCSCSQTPCTCQYGNCPYHGNAFVLPVRYDTEQNTGYVEYDYPERYRRSLDALDNYLRNNRQIELPKLGLDLDGFKDFTSKFDLKDLSSKLNLDKLTSNFNLDGLKDFTSKIDLSRFRDITSRGSDSLRKASDAAKEKFSTLQSTLDPIVSSANNFMQDSGKFMEGFKLNFALPVRERRSVDDDEEKRRRSENDKKIPVLRVKERPSTCKTIENLKRLSESRVSLRAPESIQYLPELASTQSEDSEEWKHCHSCGSQLNDSVCRSCGAHQPQYVEYIEGRPVSFYPGAMREERPEESSPEKRVPRYIYDRYGHRYLENNGNLRLIAPEYGQEAMVGEPQGFDTLKQIVEENKEVIEQLNRNGPNRMLPQPVDFAQDAIHFMHELARRDVENNRTEDKQTTESKKAVDEPKADKEPKVNPKSMGKHAKDTRKQKPKSMYQILPMKYDGHDGKMVVKVYSAKDNSWKTDDDALKRDDDTKKSEWQPELTEQSQEQWSHSDTADRSKPTVNKFNKNNKEYEILTFDHYSGNSEEEIQQILDHLHGHNSGQTTKN